jgi:hypothetical protein
VEEVRPWRADLHAAAARIADAHLAKVGVLRQGVSP